MKCKKRLKWLNCRRSRAAFRTKREGALDPLENRDPFWHYAPGQPLRQFQLVKDLGLGSTPVREAVLELLARGIPFRRATAAYASPNSISTG